jgi:lipopolysaccharide heptosyltransferase II
MKIDSKGIYKILCIKPRGIGDIVLSTIVLENLLNYFPKAKIDFLVEEFAKDALIFNPFINKVLTFNKKESFLKIIQRVRKENYDLVFDLWSNPRTAQITFLSGAKYRVGHAYRGRKFAYNIKVDSGRGDSHSAEHNLEQLKAVGIPIVSKRIHFYIDEEAIIFANDFLSDKLSDNTIYGIIPSGGWVSKRCDKEKWVEICQALLKKFNAAFLILWGNGDETDADYIYKNLKANAVLAPDTSILQLAGLIQKCDLVITNDSGPMHIAAALGIPTLGIFGPTDPKKHGPYSNRSDYIIKDDLFCIVCNKLVCPYNHECMKQLSIDLIINKIEKLLSKN